MTPTCTRLKARLDDRRRWFSDEWFFKWHFIGNDGPVTIDSFDGRGIHYGGIKFSSTARDVYWDAIVRGVRKEITEQFAWIDQEVRQYNRETALQAIDECAGQLVSFVRAIRNKAAKKDSILRGNGITFPPVDDAGNWDGTADIDIVSQAEALKSALPIMIIGPALIGPERERSGWWERSKGWHEPLGWLIAAGGVIVPAALYFLR